MPIRVYTKDGMKYRYVGADGNPYYTDQPEEDPIYSGKKLLLRMDKLREAARKSRLERQETQDGPDEDLPPAD